MRWTTDFNIPKGVKMLFRHAILCFNITHLGEQPSINILRCLKWPCPPCRLRKDATLEQDGSIWDIARLFSTSLGYQIQQRFCSLSVPTVMLALSSNHVSHSSISLFSSYQVSVVMNPTETLFAPVLLLSHPGASFQKGLSVINFTFPFNGY